MKVYRGTAIVVIAASVAFLFVTGGRVATSQTTTLTNGVNYLKSIQNTAGSWGGTTTSLNGIFPTTAAALQALRASETSTSTNQTNAIQCLTAQTVEESPFLAA